MSGRVPKRVDAATKAALMDLIGRATDAGWSTAQACRYLELPQRRLQRWRNRLADGDEGVRSSV
ncbi:MAG: helix-turn-helix domain-containing protein [Acidimicrobiia bacterium]